MITITFPKTEADYKSISFQPHNQDIKSGYLTAELETRSGEIVKVAKIFYEFQQIDSSSPVASTFLSQAVTVLHKKNCDFIDIDRTNGVVSVVIKQG